MPIYEYICSHCEAKFEILHRNSSEGKPICPDCGNTEVEKVVSIFGFSSGGKFISSSSGESCSTCGHGNCNHCG